MINLAKRFFPPKFLYASTDAVGDTLELDNVGVRMGLKRMDNKTKMIEPVCGTS